MDDKWNPEKNSDFKVDFESVFGKKIKESDSEDPWYRVSSTKIENLGHRSKEISYNQLDLENEFEIDVQFDAVFGLDAERYEGNANCEEAFDMIPKNTHKMEYVKKLVDDHYDFEDDYDD